jgi:hypothetical protein
MADGKTTVAAGVTAAALIAGGGEMLMHEGPWLLEHSGVIEPAALWRTGKNAAANWWDASSSRGRATISDGIGGASHAGIGNDASRAFSDAFPSSYGTTRYQIWPHFALDLNDRSTKEYYSYFASAQQKMFDDISALQPPVTVAQADRIIKADVSSVIEASKKNPFSDVNFEVLSGKLSVGRLTTIQGMKISGGDVNVYKISLAMAGGVAACNGMVIENFKPCVKRALAKAESAVAEQLAGQVGGPQSAK